MTQTIIEERRKDRERSLILPKDKIIGTSESISRYSGNVKLSLKLTIFDIGLLKNLNYYF